MTNTISVSQKVFIFNEEGKFLTLFRRKEAHTRPMKWDLPGGRFENGEDPKASVEREIGEETGLCVVNLKPLTVESQSYPNGCCDVAIAYRADWKSGDVVLSFEHTDFRWVTPQEFLELESSEKWERVVRENLL